MIAKMEIKGNQAKQYTLILTLPSEWLEKFAQHNAISVGGERLYSLWGESSDKDNVRHRCWTRNCVSEVESIVSVLRGELYDARDFLRTVVETERQIIIEL